ncbi:hypothetical protein WR25_23836 [Diploscapter pachys]|uniref:C2H2-type domain-containing protein n=1 Tax=Diploscapter pachys TaxID=2018661 RepID=A0A2A2J8G5_9BILA|nr:hypothetical protein WR25_23836 [Diploscapter pachys]
MASSDFGGPNKEREPVMICPLCPIKREDEELLEAHIADEHMEWYPWQCSICEKKRATVEMLQEHALAAHREQESKAN